MSAEPTRPRPKRPWWLGRWAITGAILLATPAFGLFATRVLGFWKPFYLPSEAMAPTLEKGDRIIASMRGAGELHRGDIIIFDAPMPGNGTYIKRVAALPGDRIELVNGLVYLNDRPVAQRPEGVERVQDPPGARNARRLAEQFPGEARPHRIYDMEYSEVDDFPRTVVPPGHVFVLGDNRDRSADSRVPIEQMGVALLSIANIRGKPLFHSVLSSKKFGTRI